MKGGSTHCLKGTHNYVLLIAILLTTILLWTWEENPLATILPSAQELFMMPPSEYDVEEPNYSLPSTKPKANIDEKYGHSSVRGKIEEGTDKFDADSATNSTSKMKESDESATLTADSSTKHTLQTKESDVDEILSSTTKVCNYAKGRWVESSKRPLYSGHRCKRWLSVMWACRLTKRMDFSYEGYRWQPETCEMPEFERSAFLRRMQDKTIAFIGDSLGRQQFQSLMCMVTGGEESPEVEDVGIEYDLVKARGVLRPDGWVYRFPSTNTTILYYWSASLCDLEPLNVTDPVTNIAMHLDRPPTFLSRFLHQFDVLVLNTGHHWNRGKLTANRWIMYINGKPVEDKKLLDIGNAKNFTVYSIARWVDSQLPLHPRLEAFFRTISPRHFFNGDWNTGGTCDNTTPMSGGSEVVQDGSSDSVVESALKDTKVKILDVTALSQLRDEGHISHYSHRGILNVSDCLHWCLPGIPDTWNELLVAQTVSAPYSLEG